MGTRLDIELTSKRSDGTWTWRAAGAKLPKGSLDASLLYEGAQVGDVVRAETLVGLDGVTISAIVPPPAPEPEPTRIVPRPPAARSEGGVTLVSASRPSRGRPRREPAEAGRGRQDRRGPLRAGTRNGPGDAGRGEERTARRGAPQKERAAGGPERARSDDRRRLNVGHQHRRALVGSLPPEQRPVAEALLRGGLPAVRQALAEQNAEAKAKGLPEVHAEPLLRLAEELLPKVRAAEWRDRAEAVRRDPDAVALRDLRSVVTSAEQVARDEESRALAAELRDALSRRLESLRSQWTSEIEQLLDNGHVVRALRLSARPPEPSARLSAEMAVALAERAGAALDEGSDPERWLAVLHAAAESAIRRNVHPLGLPKDAPERVLAEARALAGRVPGVAKLLGMEMPPPPGPLPPRPARPGGNGARGAPRGVVPRPGGAVRQEVDPRRGVDEADAGSEPVGDHVALPATPEAS
jgi:hypothetical protein